MPDYRAPGVYIEEDGHRTIQARSTSTAAFAGYTRRGPFAAEKRPRALHSFSDFERVFGPLADLRTPGLRINHVAHAAKAFFEEGGTRLYVARVKATGPAQENWAAAFRALLALDDISIVAAPGSTELVANANGIQSQLIAHGQASGAYRFVVLDVPNHRSPEEARAYCTTCDSRSAAFYYPWVRTSADGPWLPPSGFVGGIFARVDTERGVFKAPANEVLRSVTGLERNLSRSEQDLLNPARVNCLRSLPGRGYCIWGARTASSDPEWQYVNVRRYFIYLEQSLDLGTRWAVFEPNAEPLWQSFRSAVESFLQNEWRKGALMGSKPEHAFFVRCDRTTMTQGDIDHGRLVCLVGVAAVKPAEFVILRIGQNTARVRAGGGTTSTRKTKRSVRAKRPPL